MRGSKTIKSVKSGNWSDADTWDLGRIPRDGDKVIIANDTRVVCEPDMRPVKGAHIEFEGMGSVLDTSRIRVSGLAFKGSNASGVREE